MSEIEKKFENEYQGIAKGKRLKDFDCRLQYILGFMDYLSNKDCNRNNSRILDSFLSRGNRLKIYADYMESHFFDFVPQKN